VTNTPLVRRVLLASSAVCLVAGLLAAAVVSGGDSKPSSNLASTGATTTTVAPGTKAPTDAGTPGVAATNAAAPVTTGAPAGKPKANAQVTPTTAANPAGNSGAQGGSPTTVRAASASTFKDLGPVADAGAVAVPGPGVYHYQYKSGTDSAEAATKVENKGPAAGGGQSLVLSITGQGFDSVNDVTWGPTQVQILKSTFAFGQQRAECDWSPDYLEMQLPLSKGAQWAADTSCMVSGATPQPVPVTRKTTKKVTDARRVQVAGGEVMVWVIESVDHFDFAGNSADSTATDYFSPKLGMTVRTTGHAKGSGPRGTQERDFEIEIQSLQPS
jgi:hypothetical protein